MHKNSVFLGSESHTEGGGAQSTGQDIQVWSAGFKKFMEMATEGSGNFAGMALPLDYFLETDIEEMGSIRS